MANIEDIIKVATVDLPTQNENLESCSISGGGGNSGSESLPLIRSNISSLSSNKFRSIAGDGNPSEHQGEVPTYRSGVSHQPHTSHLRPSAGSAATHAQPLTATNLKSADQTTAEGISMTARDIREAKSDSEIVEVVSQPKKLLVNPFQCTTAMMRWHRCRLIPRMMMEVQHIVDLQQ